MYSQAKLFSTFYHNNGKSLSENVARLHGCMTTNRLLCTGRPATFHHFNRTQTYDAVDEFDQPDRQAVLEFFWILTALASFSFSNPLWSACHAPHRLPLNPT
jgi:hypothetical protein